MCLAQPYSSTWPVFRPSFPVDEVKGGCVAAERFAGVVTAVAGLSSDVMMTCSSMVRGPGGKVNVALDGEGSGKADLPASEC